jgi:hypothetical protein
MGYPVNSIKNLKERARYSHSNIVPVLMANPFSESIAVDLVRNNFQLLDTFSDKLTFYLPGYQIAFNGRDIVDRDPMFCDRWYREQEWREFTDSHLLNYYTNCIHSRRLGLVSFNEASFLDFVMEFSNNIKRYNYEGRCQMLLIPLSPNRELDYVSAKVYDLDKIVTADDYGNALSFQGDRLSIESFVLQTFRLIYDADLNSIESSGLVKQHRRELLFSAINALYDKATGGGCLDAIHWSNMQDFIHGMELWPGWRPEADLYYIGYSSKNERETLKLKDKMESNGLNVWMAHYGMPIVLDSAVLASVALKHTKQFVLILSKESADSRWVKRELEMAINNENDVVVKVVLVDGFTKENVRSNRELYSMLNRARIHKLYNYEQLLYDDDYFKGFLYNQ